MQITEILTRNAKEWPNDVALVEINPQEPVEAFRSEITWAQFDEKANRFANFLLSRGLKKGDKVAILLMNCLEWLPIYFGVLRTGCLAVPLNFRYTADEIKYCLDLADADVLVFGPEFIGRVEQIADRVPRVKLRLYVGDDCPTFAESYRNLVGYCSSRLPAVALTDDDEAAIYFSSGTTGFPKAIVLQHHCLMHSCKVEQNHHGQTKEDTFLCIPPLYHTGAKMHWFGSFLVGGKAVLLKGVKPEWILRAVSEERCTIVWLLVPWAQDILDAIERGDVKLADYKLDQWRLMHIGAQPVPPPNRPAPARCISASRTSTTWARSACLATGGRRRSFAPTAARSRRARWASWPLRGLASSSATTRTPRRRRRSSRTTAGSARATWPSCATGSSISSTARRM